MEIDETSTELGVIHLKRLDLLPMSLSSGLSYEIFISLAIGLPTIELASKLAEELCPPRGTEDED